MLTACLPHDVAGVALVHVSRHAVPTHGALQALLQAGHQGRALALAAAPRNLRQARLDEALYILSLQRILGPGTQALN